MQSCRPQWLAGPGQRRSGAAVTRLPGGRFPPPVPCCRPSRAITTRARPQETHRMGVPVRAPPEPGGRRVWLLLVQVLPRPAWLRYRGRRACGGDAGTMGGQPGLSFAGLLRQLRAEAGLTQEELAEAAGVSPRSVSDLERGIHRTAHKDTALLLADALGLAEPARALFVAAARGRGPAAEVLAAGHGQPPGAFHAAAARSDEIAIMSGPADPPRPLRAPALVGRQGELGMLRAELERARAGEFRCVLLLGEPGVGKTRLVRELLGIPQQFGLLARAYPWGATTPFGMWAEALEGHLRGLTATQVVELCGGFLDDLAGLLRTVAAARGEAPRREPPRARLLQGIAALLGNLASQAPVMVVFDDAHEADASSWEALVYLARCLPAAPVLVVATARPAELADSAVATHAVLALEQEDCLRRLPVGPLSADGLRALAAAVGP